MVKNIHRFIKCVLQLFPEYKLFFFSCERIFCMPFGKSRPRAQTFPFSLTEFNHANKLKAPTHGLLINKVNICPVLRWNAFNWLLIKFCPYRYAFEASFRCNVRFLWNKFYIHHLSWDPQEKLFRSEVNNNMQYNLRATI